MDLHLAQPVDLRNIVHVQHCLAAAALMLAEPLRFEGISAATHEKAPNVIPPYRKMVPQSVHRAIRGSRIGYVQSAGLVHARSLCQSRRSTRGRGTSRNGYIPTGFLILTTRLRATPHNFALAHL